MILAFLSFVGGSLYRMGGIGKPFNTKVRDMGVPTAMVLYMWSAGLINWWIAVSWGLMFAALTTYWDRVNRIELVQKLTKLDNPDREYWWNWALHGFFINLAMFPIVWSLDLWTAFIVRGVALTVLIASWSEFFDDVTLEEFGRGFFTIFTLGLFVVCK